MIAFEWVVSPDKRVMQRLVGLLRQTDSRRAYATAGEALATALLASKPGDLSEEARQLADAMLGSLLLVQRAAHDDEPEDRVRLALATAVLSVVRPHTESVCDSAIGAWIGFGIGSPRRMQDEPEALAARVLLALLVGDADHAAEAVDVLVDVDRSRIAGILYDWVVARIQGHGRDREAQCFHALRLALSHVSGEGYGAALIVVGAMIVHRTARLDRGAVARWLDRVATEVVQHGTTSISAAS